MGRTSTERRRFGSTFRASMEYGRFACAVSAGVNDPRQGVLEQVQIGVVADGVGEQGRDAGARIVALGPAFARLVDPFYP